MSFEHHLMICLNALVPLGWFWVQFWTLLGAKGLPEIEQNDIQETVWNKYKHVKEFWWGNIVLGGSKAMIFMRFTAGLQCRLGFRLFHESIEKSSNMYTKIAPEMLNNRAWRCHGLEARAWKSKIVKNWSRKVGITSQARKIASRVRGPQIRVR